MKKGKARKAAPRKVERPVRPKRYAVGFLGGGNMATALVAGFLEAKICAPADICVSDVDAAKLRTLKKRFGVDVTSNNRDVVARSKAVLLAVKPQIVSTILDEIRAVATTKQVFVSILAGTPTARLEGGLCPGARVVRVMPNTPSLLGKGMAVAVRGKNATAADERLTLRLMRAVGRARAVADERLMDAVTGLSGSGPAYVYRFAEALIAGGIAAGLTGEVARELALQTITGAAAMLQESGETPERLREMVSSPGGTTLAGLTELQERGFFEAVQAAVVRAKNRSIELGRG